MGILIRMAEEMLKQKILERENETMQLECWELLGARELNIYAYHHFQTTVSFRHASTTFDKLEIFSFSHE